MVGKTALNKEMKHLNGAYFRTISANFPASIAFRVATQPDSRVIIHNADASKLLGKGDMLFSHISGPTRVQCAYVDKKEINRVVSFIAQQEINQ